MVEKRVVQLSEHKFDAAVDQRDEDRSSAFLCWKRRIGRTGRFTFDVTESISTRMYWGYLVETSFSKKRWVCND